MFHGKEEHTKNAAVNLQKKNKKNDICSHLNFTGSYIKSVEVLDKLRRYTGYQKVER